jgi:hypothetical protein
VFERLANGPFVVANLHAFVCGRDVGALADARAAGARGGVAQPPNANSAPAITSLLIMRYTIPPLIEMICPLM